MNIYQAKEGKILICPFCKKEVEDARYCSNCSKPLHPKWYQKNSLATITIMIFAVIFLIVCVVVFVTRSNSLSSDSRSQVYNSSVEITLEQFNVLQPGMTYEEAVEIVGGYGVLLSQTELSDEEFAGYAFDLSQYDTEIYGWDGNGAAGANAMIVVQNGKIVSKTQVGLQ